MLILSDERQATMSFLTGFVGTAGLACAVYLLVVLLRGGDGR